MQRIRSTGLLDLWDGSAQQGCQIFMQQIRSAVNVVDEIWEFKKKISTLIDINDDLKKNTWILSDMRPGRNESTYICILLRLLKFIHAWWQIFQSVILYKLPLYRQGLISCACCSILYKYSASFEFYRPNMYKLKLMHACRSFQNSGHTDQRRIQESGQTDI